MKVKQGYIVKIADIGTLGTVVKVGENGMAAVVEFDFPEGRVESVRASVYHKQYSFQGESL